ncbi:MAG: YwiC-like family protein [Candidatus Omnitrophota bacterium]|nr:YwiC-like family protein [Candidatus Omnitrophota bacterium]
MRQPQGAFFAVVPKQHGAWTVLVASFIIGFSVGARFSLEVILLLVSVIAAFLGRGALGRYLYLSPAERRTQGLSAWIMLYFGLFLLSGAWLMFWYKLWFLGLLGIAGIGLAAFSLSLEKDKRDMTLGGQIINILGLSLIAPAAQYCASGSYSLKTLEVWLVCILFFLGSVFHVRFLLRRRLEAAGELGERLRAGFVSLTFHLSALLAVIVLSKLKVIPLFAPLALVPVTLKALWPIIRRNRNPLPVKLIGRLELIHTLVFLVIMVVVFADR